MEIDQLVIICYYFALGIRSVDAPIYLLLFGIWFGAEIGARASLIISNAVNGAESIATFPLIDISLVIGVTVAILVATRHSVGAHG